MSDLAATNCGCSNDNGCGCNNIIWIILLLCCCGGGCGNGNGSFLGGNGCSEADVTLSGSSCFCAAVADTVETTMETAVAASKPQEPEASTPPVLILLRFFSLPLHLLLPFPFFLFPQAVFIYLIYTFTIIN